MEVEMDMDFGGGIFDGYVKWEKMWEEKDNGGELLEL